MSKLRTDNLTVPVGTAYRYQWPLVDSAGQPVSLIGYTARSQVRESKSSPTVLHEFTTNDGGLVLAEGTITMYFPKESSDWTWRRGVYDIEIVSPQDVPTRITQGTILLDGEVTR